MLFLYFEPSFQFFGVYFSVFLIVFLLFVFFNIVVYI